MKYLFILLGIFSITVQIKAQNCHNTIYTNQVSTHYPAADLQIAAFFSNAVCEAYDYIDSRIGSEQNRGNMALVTDINEEAWTTIMTQDKINTAFAGKTNLKNLFVDGIFSRNVRGCIDEINDMALLANSYSDFLQDLIFFVSSQFYLNLSPPEQQQVSSYISFIEYTLQIANAKVKNVKGDGSTKGAQCIGWWRCWGRCIVGTIGGAVSGGIAGAVAGGAVSGVGAVPGGLIGAAAGAASGAAEFCD